MDVLVTRRLTLRPPLEVDADAITAALQNPKVTRMLTSVPSPYTVADAQAWIKRIENEKHASYFSIYREKFLGVVSVRHNQNGEADLGYWLDEAAWGQGYMSEAARAVTSHAFRRFNLERMESGAYEDNRASQRVLEKLGFERTQDQPHYNQTRKCEVSCKRVELTRDRFEQIFGSLETNVAA